MCIRDRLEGVRRTPQPFAAPMGMPPAPLRHYKEEIPGLTQALSLIHI